ncbi:MAG: YceI family protein [Gammaproteobacteria bacterium]|nr:YceI family protein [Gammaproteobacteria bacterium]
MKHQARWLCLFLVMAAATTEAADWNMDPATSRLEFIPTYESQPAPGVFKQFDTQLTQFEPEQPAGGQLQVNVTIGSADMASGEVNEAVQGTEWFDSKRFPQAQFKSRQVRRVAPGRYVAKGTLNLKGVQKDVEVPFNWKATADGATMDGELTLNRNAFNVGTGEWAAGDVIGQNIKLKFKIGLRKHG